LPCSARLTISSAVKIERLVLSAVSRSNRFALPSSRRMALAHPHAVGEMVGDLVIDERHAEPFGQAACDVLAERAHLPGDRDERHILSPCPSPLTGR
jgi:hypothetical protein